MSKVMKHLVEAASRRRAVDEPEVDRIPGTSKLRTYCADNPSLYSGEDTIKNIVKAVEFCSIDKKEK